MDLLSLGKEPISEDQPTGSDVRYEPEFEELQAEIDPEFEELQAEIDKLSNPSASGEMDWQKVNKLSTEILSNKAKDLLVASYLAVAQIHTGQMEGFGVGYFWDNLFPAKKRMRGRIAAIEWWLEKSEAALQLLKVDPSPAEKVEEYRQALQQIDKLLQEYLEDAPLLRPLERGIDSLPIKAEKKPEPEAPPSLEAKPEVQPAPKPEPDRSKPAPPAEVGEIASESDANSVLRGVLQTMNRVANYFFFHKDDLSNPQAYRWRRIAGWSMIQALPQGTNGRTQIPAPVNHDTIQNDLNGLKDQGNWEVLLRAAEEKFQGAVLLNRFVSEALAGLGDQYQDAHDTVCQETAYLIHRLPGIESLSYSNGTPFGDTETQQWLKGIGLGGGTAMVEPVAAAGAEESGHMTETIQKAQALAKKKKVGEAVSILQQELRSSYSKREQLLWRLGLSQILVHAKKPQLALPHLESVLQDIDAYKLEEWDPNLALKGLKMVWQGFSTHSDEVGKKQATHVLNRIAKLDPTEALRLGK
jgi:type VI secretion system protein VasJ